MIEMGTPAFSSRLSVVCRESCRPIFGQPRALEHARELVGVRLRVMWSPKFVDDDVLVSLGVPVEVREHGAVGRSSYFAFMGLALAELDERGHQVVIAGKSSFAVVALGFLDPDPVVDEHPRLTDRQCLGLQVDV
jgi:hypothetical protein